jgi:amino-acid N-acetyltransferase
VTSDAAPAFTVRRARTSDVVLIEALIAPLVANRILLGKDRVVFYEAVQEFRVAVDDEGSIIGFGALHVFWEDLGEIRTLAVADEWLGRGVGRALLVELEAAARDLGLSRLFCLTFEREFFVRQGFHAVSESTGEKIIDSDVYYELVRSPDEGIAEFLELARVKPNTLGNTRMLKHLA